MTPLSIRYPNDKPARISIYTRKSAVAINGDCKGDVSRLRDRAMNNNIYIYLSLRQRKCDGYLDKERNKYEKVHSCGLFASNA